MLSEAELDRICVVLVRARNPANIGAVARAMHDFGFTRLRIVNDFPVPFEAARSAVDASAVLARAESFATVADAVADSRLVVGTTAVGKRDVTHPVLTLAQAAPKIRAAVSGDAPVALLFGSEKTGLSNDEMSHCHWLLTIPMWEHDGLRHPSMNLGQAAAVCLYELVRSDETADLGIDATGVTAAAGDMERLRLLLAETLEATEYTRHHPANSDAAHLRRLVTRMGLEAADVPVWMGILRQVLWKLRRDEPGR
jgi:TrmH family RNA methyltransferase